MEPSDGEANAGAIYYPKRNILVDNNSVESIPRSESKSERSVEIIRGPSE